MMEKVIRTAIEYKKLNDTFNDAVAKNDMDIARGVFYNVTRVERELAVLKHAHKLTDEDIEKMINEN